MNLIRSFSNQLSKSYLEYDSQKLLAKLEYHMEMAQSCEELLIKNRIKLETLEREN